MDWDYYCPHCTLDDKSRMHKQGCPLEQCPACGRHLRKCVCSSSGPDAAMDRLPMPSKDPSYLACEALGWFVKLEGDVWVQCGADSAGAIPDVSRLYSEARWDSLQKQFVPIVQNTTSNDKEEGQ